MSNGRIVVERVETLEFVARSLVPGVRILGLKATVETASILVTVIDEEITEIKISFLAFGAVNN